MMPIDFEGIAADRMRSWEREIEHRLLVSRFPRRRPFWVRWLGDGMVLAGNWLASWGRWLAQREYRQSVTAACD
jgi:hypothetical protein